MQNNLDVILTTEMGVDQAVLSEAKRMAAEKGGGVGEFLVQKKALTEDQYLTAMERMYGMEVWKELGKIPLEFGYTGKVPIHFLKRHKMVPLFLKPDEDRDPDSEPVVVAVHDPATYHALDDLCRILDITSYNVVLAPQQEIISAINTAFDLGRDSAEQLVQNMEEESPDEIISELEKTADLLDDTSDAPIIRLVNHILSQAVKARASDIHIEPYQYQLKVRYRVDGILYDLIAPPKRIQSAIISRIKVMASMNIAEKRLPQDGRIEIRIGDKNVDIRVSTVPTSFGERVVLRLLDKSSTLLKLTDVGFSAAQLKTVSELIHSPYGILLVTGPTGSGKTTTLYAALSTINTPDINIITIEDPVEYQIEGIGQIQVNPKIELTFARGLRSIVRQDPDVILVGEIRDHETAEIAVQSSLTGHLVFSTLHTNDSASAITRLDDMGVEPFLISSSVLAVMAQRLVRKLCATCREVYEPDDAALAMLRLERKTVADHIVYRGVGCQECLQTGYRGRVGIFEIMNMDRDIKTLLLTSADANQIKAQAVKNGMLSLRRDGVSKMLAGITSIEEVFRVTQQ
ncbi:MAG: type II secretion system ATPase GspE [Desulfatibacillaceae bacterium]